MSKPSKRVRRTFTNEFKRDTVNLVLKQGYTFAAAAEAVGVAPKSVREWHEKFAPPPEPCSDDASVEEMQAEIKLLRKQLAKAELEREILKKATAYFAKESQ